MYDFCNKVNILHLTLTNWSTKNVLQYALFLCADINEASRGD